MALDPVAAFLQAKTLRRLRSRLRRNEVVEGVTPGAHDGRVGSLVVTNRRMFWVPASRWRKIEERPRSRMHELRRGNKTHLMDEKKPGWQVRGAPAVEARLAARATVEEAAPEVRPDRVTMLERQGIITADEARWMRQE